MAEMVFAAGVKRFPLVGLGQHHAEGALRPELWQVDRLVKEELHPDWGAAELELVNNGIVDVH